MPIVKTRIHFQDGEDFPDPEVMRHTTGSYSISMGDQLDLFFPDFQSLEEFTSNLYFELEIFIKKEKQNGD